MGRDGVVVRGVASPTPSRLRCANILTRNVLSFVALVSIVTGCGAQYPQLTGRYHLDPQSVSYSSPELRGDYNIPAQITVDHKMFRHSSTGLRNSIQHFVRIKSVLPTAPTSAEASLNVVAPFDYLLGRYHVGPNQYGVSLTNDQRITRSQPGGNCFELYDWQLRVEVTPSIDELVALYPTQEVEPNGRSTTTPIRSDLANRYLPSAQALQRWESAVEANGGVKIRFVARKVFQFASQSTDICSSRSQPAELAFEYVREMGASVDADGPFLADTADLRVYSDNRFELNLQQFYNAVLRM